MMTMKADAAQGDEVFYSVRITGTYDRSTRPSSRACRSNVRFHVYAVRDGLVAEELSPEQALATMHLLGLLPDRQP